MESLETAIIEKGWKWEDDLLVILRRKGLARGWWNPESSDATPVQRNVRDMDVETRLNNNCTCSNASTQWDFMVHYCVDSQNTWNDLYQTHSKIQLVRDSVPGHDVIYQPAMRVTENFFKRDIDRKVIG